MYKQTELSYRLAAIEGATSLGLVLALYDRLVADLQRGAEAIRVSDIEARCAALNHAHAVLGQLESWIDPESDPALASSLKNFYAHLRSRTLAAGVRKSAVILNELVDLVLDVRATWQQRESAFRAAPSHAA
jgi:flagellar protein FliS